ncbi:MAG: hypothetical protein OXE57_09970 [Alphaproteobacteria bacterium]|nr:hypothetical protein [Alphaproteobacteria bacterium]
MDNRTFRWLSALAAAVVIWSNVMTGLDWAQYGVPVGGTIIIGLVLWAFSRIDKIEWDTDRYNNHFRVEKRIEDIERREKESKKQRKHERKVRKLKRKVKELESVK